MGIPAEPAGGTVLYEVMRDNLTTRLAEVRLMGSRHQPVFVFGWMSVAKKK